MENSIVLDDFSQLNGTRVKCVFRPRHVQEVQEIVRKAAESGTPVIACGQRHSQGGHALCAGGFVIDTRELNQILHLDVAERRVRAQAGATWTDLQCLANRYGLAIAVMQSAPLFTIGGSVSVNAHGSDPRYGPLVDTIVRLTLVTADGQLVHTSRDQHPDLFWAVCGGYGLLGVIVEVELELTTNDTYEQRAHLVSSADYPSFVNDHVVTNPSSGGGRVGLHWGRLALPPYSDSDQVLAVTFTHYPATGRPWRRRRALEQIMRGLQHHVAGLLSLVGLADPSATVCSSSSSIVSPLLSLQHQDGKVVKQEEEEPIESANRWGPLDCLFTNALRQRRAFEVKTFWARTLMRESFPWTASRNSFMQHPSDLLDYWSETDTDVLQSYFLPPDDRFVIFVEALRQSLRVEEAVSPGDGDPADRGPRVLFNLVRCVRPENTRVPVGCQCQRQSQRLGPHDDPWSTYLAYAPMERLEIVLHVNHGRSPYALNRMREWTTFLMEQAVQMGGTYYLPVRNLAPVHLFEQAYSASGRKKFLAAKNRWDPRGVFQNQFAAKYLCQHGDER